MKGISNLNFYKELNSKLESTIKTPSSTTWFSPTLIRARDSSWIQSKKYVQSRVTIQKGTLSLLSLKQSSSQNYQYLRQQRGLQVGLLVFCTLPEASATPQLDLKVLSDCCSTGGVLISGLLLLLGSGPLWVPRWVTPAVWEALIQSKAKHTKCYQVDLWTDKATWCQVWDKPNKYSLGVVFCLFVFLLSQKMNVN